MCLVALLGLFAMLLAACGGTGAASDAPAGDEQTGDELTDDGGTDAEEAAEHDDFPNQPITLLVGFGAGGANDLIARRIAPIMSDILGVPIQVENLPGGAGIVATDEMLNREPDGYTLVTHQFMSDLLEDLPFERDDLTVLGQNTDDPAAVAVPMDSPYENLEQFNEAAQSGDVTAAHPGITGLAGLATAYYELEQDVRFTHLTYDSGSDMHAALIGGHTDSAFRAGGWYDAHGNELRILGLMAEERVDEISDVPTIEEVTGERMVFTAARGIAVPSDVPENRIQILADAFAEASQSDEYQQGMLEELGFRPEFRSREEAAELQAEMEEIVRRLVEEELLTER